MTITRIRKFQKRDTIQVAQLVFNTFKKYNSKDYFKKEGIKKYLNFHDIKKNTVDSLYENYRRSTIIYVAIIDEKVVGVIRGNSERIINLFVDKNYHKKGIGKQLVDKFESVCKNNKVKVIKIKASSYAIPFYKKMGYKQTTGVRSFWGIKVYPMKKIIKNE